MLTSSHYLLRSTQDGSYLSARPNPQQPDRRYLLLFGENFEARSYLNTHAPDFSDRITIETVAGSQLKGVLERWGFVGIAQVQDPLVPTLQFFDRS
ncbi:hypothetical protein [Prochlorothrix hollandica]|uniref:Uncharacterized protein n=1 Tax=Prochlorothrix hollandica PCC 9006 = CALU 1027 TaxID=317619 RepID=A0A0M2PT55_PROHO|nr:hypothetical protein [Prochlorothrix hollandica]KKI98337.1 hypothetical protein PROH_19425 [Prochlorothrix hollandica PCC 9006 = CALU 1027]